MSSLRSDLVRYGKHTLDPGGVLTLGALHELVRLEPIELSPKQLHEVSLCLSDPPRCVGPDEFLVPLPVRIKVDR